MSILLIQALRSFLILDSLKRLRDFRMAMTPDPSGPAVSRDRSYLQTDFLLPQQISEIHPCVFA